MRRATSIVFVLFCLQCFGEAKNTGKVKAVIGLYCPIKTNWKWEIILGQHSAIPDRREFADRHGDATEEFQFIEMDVQELETRNLEREIFFIIDHKCSTDGSEKSEEIYIGITFSTNKVTYNFIAANLESIDHTEAVYEKLFVQYLKNECSTGDCSTVKQRILCSQIKEANQVEQCKNGLEKAYTFCMDNRDSKSTTQKSNTITFIIIGAAVGVVLLIAGFVACFFCRRKKKTGPDASGMMSGTTSKTKTMTKSGTTKQTTATGTFLKTAQTGTNVTGVQRY